MPVPSPMVILRNGQFYEFLRIIFYEFLRIVFLKKVVLDILGGKDILINNDFSNLIYCHFTVSCLIEFQHVCLTEQKNE